MKTRTLYFIFTLILAVSLQGSGLLSAEAGELNSYDNRSAPEQALKRVPDSDPESLGLPIFPSAKEITGNSLEQGSFQARSFIFTVPTSFNKVLDFYKSRLGQNISLKLAETATNHHAAHFYFAAGSQSRNVVLEEISPKETRLTLTVFEGGGSTL